MWGSVVVAGCCHKLPSSCLVRPIRSQLIRLDWKGTGIVFVISYGEGVLIEMNTRALHTLVSPRSVHRRNAFSINLLQAIFPFLWFGRNFQKNVAWVPCWASGFDCAQT